MDIVSYIINSHSLATPQFRLTMEKARIANISSKFKLQIAVTHLATLFKWNFSDVILPGNFLSKCFFELLIVTHSERLQ